ncbi:GntR family transcriptional regulator [Pseudactinotalea terrae]|uniref:GntR family transcriptional regulator n=1 Tax=Pseudactinotalea terrae TaxID=1743262 RepID=UPI0012E276F2|nr:GntR family transcriptional regulator [Pseudactinotalea terrae]
MGTSSRVAVDHAHQQLVGLIERHRQEGVDRLPTEAELSTELGVSRNSLREALALLESQGVVSRRRRVGTLIVPTPDRADRSLLEYPIDSIVSIPDFFSGAGRPVEISSVTVVQELADATIAAQLDVAEGDDVYRVRRVYVWPDGPVAVGEHAIPKVLRGHGIHIEALTDGISTFLADVENIQVDVVEHTASAVAADDALARDLHVPRGTAMLVVDATLMAVEADTRRAVAIGRLAFDPRKVAVRATATPKR